VKRPLLYVSTFCLAVLTGPAMAESQQGKPSQPAPRADVIARVGDQSITFSELNTVLNSSAVVGISIPAVGTPERDTARLVVLDKLIGASLIYLDALAKGFDRDPEYLRDAAGFRKAILAGLYRQRYLVGDIQVSDAEVDEYLLQHGFSEGESEAQLRPAAEAKIRRQKLEARLADARARLRDGVSVSIYSNRIAVAGDAARSDDTPVAEIDGTPVPWGEVKRVLTAAGGGAIAADPLAIPDDARLEALEREIDLRLMAAKAVAEGLDRDPVYQARSREYLKSRLVNLYRKRLIQDLEPDEATLRAFYQANRSRFMQPEMRRVQMVVVGTRDEAADLKARLDAGDLTMYQAAREYSVAANAKQDLGDVGWVSRGETVPELDSVIFAARPGETGGPVKTPAGWHLVRVKDMEKAKFDDFDDPATRALAHRRYLGERLDAYTVELRKTRFPVEVDEVLILRLAQEEADSVRRLAQQAAQPGSVTEQRVKQLQDLMHPQGSAD